MRRLARCHAPAAIHAGVAIAATLVAAACSFPPLPELTDAVADRSPPTVISRSPTNGAVDVTSGAVVSLTFSEPISSSSVGVDTLVVTAAGARVAGSTTVDGATVTFTPEGRLPPGASCTAAVSAAVSDLAGNPLGQASDWTFQTGTRSWTPPAQLVNEASRAASGLYVSFREGRGVAAWTMNDCTPSCSNTTSLSAWIALYETGAWRVARLVPTGSSTARVVGVGIDRLGNVTLIAQGAHLIAVRVSGGSPSAPMPLETLESDYRPSPDLQLGTDDQGNIVILWARDAGTAHIWWSRYTFNQGWTAATPLSASGDVAAFPSLAVRGDGSAVAAWGQDGMLQAATMTSTGAWSNPVPVAATSNAQVAVAAASDGSATAIWRESLALRASRLATTWSTRLTPISAGGSGPGSVRLHAMTSGKLLAFWTESRGTSVDLWHAAFTPGQDWSDPGMLEMLSGDVQDPRITGEGDRATLAWRSTFQTGEVLGWVKTFSASSGWGEPGEFARGPDMSDVRPYYDPRNNESGAVWIEAKAGNLASVFFSALR